MKKVLKVEPHTHNWQFPVLSEDNENYVIHCSLCPTSIKITKAQFLQGGYNKKDYAQEKV